MQILSSRWRKRWAAIKKLGLKHFMLNIFHWRRWVYFCSMVPKFLLWRPALMRETARRWCNTNPFFPISSSSSGSGRGSAVAESSSARAVFLPQSWQHRGCANNNIFGRCRCCCCWLSQQVFFSARSEVLRLFFIRDIECKKNKNKHNWASEIMKSFCWRAKLRWTGLTSARIRWCLN